MRRRKSCDAVGTDALLSVTELGQIMQTEGKKGTNLLHEQ